MDPTMNEGTMHGRMFEELWTYAGAMSAVLIAAAASSVGSTSDERLVMHCVIGSIGGALLSIAVWDGPKKESVTTKDISGLRMKFAASFVCGIIFSPMVVVLTEKWLDTSRGLPLVLAVSGIVGMVGTYTITVIRPVYDRWLMRKAKSLDVDETKQI